MGAVGPNGLVVRLHSKTQVSLLSVYHTNHKFKQKLIITTISRTATNAPSADNLPAITTAPVASASGSVLSSQQSSQSSDNSSQQSASDSSAPPQPSAKRRRKKDALEAALLSQLSGLGELIESQRNTNVDTTDASERFSQMVVEIGRAHV